MYSGIHFYMYVLIRVKSTRIIFIINYIKPKVRVSVLCINNILLSMEHIHFFLKDTRVGIMELLHSIHTDNKIIKAPSITNKIIPMRTF